MANEKMLGVIQCALLELNTHLPPKKEVDEFVLLKWRRVSQEATQDGFSSEEAVQLLSNVTVEDGYFVNLVFDSFVKLETPLFTLCGMEGQVGAYFDFYLVLPNKSKLLFNASKAILEDYSSEEWKCLKTHLEPLAREIAELMDMK